jgi:hypothetical protein
MGGIGEKVKFQKFRAKKGDAAARDQLKRDIVATIERSAETITVIALIEDSAGGSGQPGGGGG